MLPTPGYPEQVVSDVYIMELLYIVSTFGVMFAVLSVLLIDAGLVRSKNIMDTMVQKLICALIGGTSFMIVGYGIWNWQFYQALGVEGSLRQAIADWWLGGHNMTVFGSHLDPATVPQADFQQLFAVFFFAFGALVASFMHGAGLERMKPQASFVMAALGGGLFLPVTTYLTWSSASFLTNNGVHDFVGAFSLYIFVSIWGLVLAWRLGPRRGYTGIPGNYPLVAGATFALICAIPLVVIGCGYIVPGKGYFGITETESGLGILFANVFLALGGGTVSGAALAYHQRKSLYALLGPVAGYICCTALYDIVMPWQAFLIALPGPFLLMAGLKLVAKLGIDEPKIAPLAFLPAVYSVVMAGLVGNGLPAGGVMGITEGAYAMGHAHISLGGQFYGLAVMILGTLVCSLVFVVAIEKVFGLRVTAAEEDEGLDIAYWQAKPAVEAKPESASALSAAAESSPS